MSSKSYSNDLLRAFNTPAKERTEMDLMAIFHHIHRLEALNGYKEQSIRALCTTIKFEVCEANTVLYKCDDPCTCWYILQSGSVFIQGSMFLPRASFGKQIPGTKRRGSQCIALEDSEMLVIDYPEVHSHQHHHSHHHQTSSSRHNSISQQQSSTVNHRSHHKSDSLNSARSSTQDSVTEIESSSTDSSPAHTTEQENTHDKNSSSLQDNLSRSQSSISKTTEDGDDFEEQDDEEDSISLRSESSIYMKDLVIDVVKKGVHERNADDLAILMEFTKSLKAFSNMTEPTRRALCKVMVFAWVENAHTTVLKENEELDSWSVIINGQVLVKVETSKGSMERTLCMGESFGVEPTPQKQRHKGVMTTLCDDCQFLCVAQDGYCEVLNQGKENMDSFYDTHGQLCMVKERRDDEGKSRGSIVIRGSPDQLLQHLLEVGSTDGTFAEDYLLTYRSFDNSPLKILRRLLDCHDSIELREKVVRTILLWVNNHFSDFECNWKMMALLEEFDEKLKKCSSVQALKLFKIACTAKAKPRSIHIVRESNEQELGFELWGGAAYDCPVYISTVNTGSEAESKGVKRGDQLIEVNGQNVEKLVLEKAQILIKKNTELRLLLKTSLFSFKEMIEVSDQKKPVVQKRPNEKNRSKSRAPSMTLGDDVFIAKVSSKGGTLGRILSFPRRTMFSRKSSMGFIDFVRKHGQESADDSYLPNHPGLPGAHKSHTMEANIGSRNHSRTMSSSNPDLLDPGSNSSEPQSGSDAPEDVIKVYRSDQSHRFIFVNRDTTAGDAVLAACREFAILSEVHAYSLYKVSVAQGKFIKQSKLPDPLVNLQDIRLGSRYYLKKLLSSEILLPDDNISDLLKEENFSFLDLNCFEVALHLTKDDYLKFQSTESTHFINDLFSLQNSDVQPLKDFEALVNKEHFWIATMICSESNCLQRSKIIKNVIKVSHHCKMLKNLNSTFALISGLGYRSVSRMKQTWEKVPAKSCRMFEDLQGLMDPSRNMSKYRTLYNEMIGQPPVIPYIPVVKKDLTFLHLGNDTRVEGLINFEKMRMIAREVRNICRLCAPDTNQLIPSAIVANQSGSDRGGGNSSSAYQTLARRGRRSSFNNARRMYEDQINQRRVRQFMKQIEIVEDEDQLMEMSKKVESLTPLNSSQTKRRATGAGNTDSPSRSSKTLPTRSGSACSGSSQHSTNPATSSSVTASARNNSEPQIAQIPTITLLPTRRKVPVTSLPKFGATSPRALKKLMALSVEGHEHDKKGGGKSGKARSSSTSNTVATNMISSSNINNTRASSQRERTTSGNNNNSVGHENSNRNNNRHSMPPCSDQQLKSARSSITSTSSGISSNPTSASSLTLSGSSPRSTSPVSWGSAGSISTNSSTGTHGNAMKPPLPRTTQLHGRSGPYMPPPSMAKCGPLRTSSNSSADTVKSTGSKTRGGQQAQHPIIMTSSNRNSSRTSSLGIGSSDRNLMALPDRRVAAYTLTSSSSTPSLNAHSSTNNSAAATSLSASQSGLILPNHPQIPRTSSCDSGIISAGSISTDSNRFSQTEDSELFVRHPNHPTASALTNQQRGGSGHQDQQQRKPQQQQQPNEEDTEDKIEQSFLFGSRGLRGAPLVERKDPNCCSNQVIKNHHHHQRKVVNNTTSQPQQFYEQQHSTGYPMLFQKKVVKGINEYLVCERQTSLKNRLYRQQTFPYAHQIPDYQQQQQQPSPHMHHQHHHGFPNDFVYAFPYQQQQSWEQMRPPSGSMESSLEEQLLMMELEKQGPHVARHKPQTSAKTVVENRRSRHHDDLDHHDYDVISYDSNTTLKRSHFASSRGSNNSTPHMVHYPMHLDDVINAEATTTPTTNNIATASPSPSMTSQGRSCPRPADDWRETELDAPPQGRWEVESPLMIQQAVEHRTMKRKNHPPSPQRKSSSLTQITACYDDDPPYLTNNCNGFVPNGGQHATSRYATTDHRQMEQQIPYKEQQIEVSHDRLLPRRSLPTYHEALQKRINSAGGGHHQFVNYTNDGRDGQEQVSQV